jgi:Arc/MetJ-type ribon-helix-helix transcriptional regulator
LDLENRDGAEVEKNMTTDEETRNIPVRIPVGFLKTMDELIAQGFFKSRSEYIFYAVRQYTEEVLRKRIYETKTLEPKKEQ